MSASDTPKKSHEIATFACGCFWGIEAAFRKVKGVLDVVVGYTGGHTEHPTYEQVCSDTTGHAEAVHILFDPTIVSYEQLLNVFESLHDPHKRAHKSQYRSAIFFHSEEQRAIAERFKRGTTEIVPASRFWRAESHHQRYHEKHGGSCSA